MNRKIVSVFLIICQFITWSNSDSDFREEVQPGPGKTGDSGIEARLSEKGVQYIGRTSGEILRQGVQRIRIPPITINAAGGSATLSNIRVTRFKPADSYTFKLASANKASYRVENIDATIQGHMVENIMSISDSGEFVGVINGATLDVTVLVQRDGPYPKFIVDSCQVDIKHVQLTLSNMQHKLIQNLVNSHVDVQNKMLPKLEAQACVSLKQVVEEKLNNEIKKRPPKEPLIQPNNSPLSVQVSTNSAIQRQIMDAFKQMFFDRSLTKDPRFGANMGDFWLKGEVSWQGQGGTPFQPSLLFEDALPRGANDKMIYVTVSDYVLNSLFYNAYKHQALNFKIDKKEMPDFSKVLRTSCGGDEICVGSVLPEVAKSYPNDDLSVKITPSKAPAVILTNDKGTILLDGIVALFANDKQLADMDLNAEIEFQPTLSNNLLKGQMSVKKVTGKLRSSNIKEITQDKIDDWTKMGSTMVESMANDQLQKGIPLPQNRLIQMQNAQLRVFERRLRVDTDLQANIPVILDVVQDYINKEGPNLAASVSASASAKSSNRGRRNGKHHNKS